MSSRPKHPIKELEAVLKEAEGKGWLVTKGKKYFMMWCSCAKKHKKSLKLTPSTRTYKKNLMGELRRATCWED